MDEKAIQKGFNQGYYLRTNAPKLADQYTKVLADKEDGYAIGFVAGVKEKDKEKYLTKRKNYTISKTPDKIKIHLKDKKKDKSDREI